MRSGMLSDQDFIKLVSPPSMFTTFTMRREQTDQYHKRQLAKNTTLRALEHNVAGIFQSSASRVVPEATRCLADIGLLWSNPNGHHFSYITIDPGRKHMYLLGFQVVDI